MDVFPEVICLFIYYSTSTVEIIYYNNIEPSRFRHRTRTKQQISFQDKISPRLAPEVHEARTIYYGRFHQRLFGRISYVSRRSFRVRLG